MSLWCDHCARPLENGLCAFCAAVERGEEPRDSPSKETLLRRITRDAPPRRPGELPKCPHCGQRPTGLDIHSRGGPSKDWLDPWGHNCPHGDPCPSAGLAETSCTACRETAKAVRANRLYEAHGRRQTITQWARETGISTAAIRRRLAQGWPEHLALTTPRTTTPLDRPAVTERAAKPETEPALANLDDRSRSNLDVIVEVAQRLGLAVLARDGDVVVLRAA